MVGSERAVYFLKRLMNQRWEYLAIGLLEINREEEDIFQILNEIKEEEKFRKELNKKRQIKVLLDCEENKARQSHRFFTCNLSEDGKKEYQFLERDRDIPEGIYNAIKEYKATH
ncbi:hypothetical protein [Lachnobacterium bovis]|uniref:Uncharacterized protein n=1 Tax=Lachnobacterium bovis TaxID=140626 RepID=A0A1H9PF95_9FIRM|nr:hypothetical protein [Lachnobacterium bovis]SER46233.1 hypothetical protein SAMN02910429_00208 [Lachnobacterium bovis]